MDRTAQTVAGCFLTGLLCVECLSVTHCKANNTSFLPGDAFFYCRLDSDDIAALLKSDPAVFRYGNHWDGGFGCGFAGYARASAPDLPKSQKESLVRIYGRLKEFIEPDGHGDKKMSVFFYNSNYDWQKHGLGIQYNEDWVEETAAFGHSLDHLRLESFMQSGVDLTTKASILEKAWRDSPRIGPLDATIPQLPPKPNPAESLKEPIVLGSAFQIIVIPNRNFHDYWELSDGVVVAVLSEDGVAWFHVSAGEWKTGPPGEVSSD